MALRTLVSESNLPYIYSTFTFYQKPTFQSKGMLLSAPQCKISRRIGVIVVTVSTLLEREAIFSEDIANAIDFRMIAPDQTVEQAESGLKDHAESLLQVKYLLESESWREAQKALRASAASLKQDIYTLIQNKPASERAQLRKLYSDLFNSVTKLDYAARDKDASRVWLWYDNMVVALDSIISRIAN